jgi:hypothetical protein
VITISSGSNEGSSGSDAESSIWEAAVLVASSVILTLAVLVVFAAALFGGGRTTRHGAALRPRVPPRPSRPLGR